MLWICTRNAGRGTIAALVACVVLGCSPAEKSDTVVAGPPSNDAVPARVPSNANDPARTHAGRDREPPDAEIAAKRRPPGARPAVVTSVTDGDTIRVRSDGADERVRFLAIDAPETRGGCGASEATAAVRTAAAPGDTVWLEPDVEQRDRNGRLLRYVWLADGTLLNERLVHDGLVNAKLYLPNDRYWERLQTAERHAIARDRGIWAQCAPLPDDDGDGEGDGDDRSAGRTDRTASGAIPADTAGGADDTAAARDVGPCDANYSGCVPPYPPDVDCSRVDGPVAVIGADPHHLDGNGDGQGCEGPPAR